MNQYIQSILVITTVCHIFSLLTPSTTGIRKTYRFLCGMVVLAVIALPICDVVSGIVCTVESWQIAETAEPYGMGTEDMRFASATKETALGWMRYISVVYGIPMEDMEMCVTEENEEITEIRLYVADLPTWECRQMETNLAARMEAAIHVWEKNGAEWKRETEKQTGSGE